MGFNSGFKGLRSNKVAYSFVLSFLRACTYTVAVLIDVIGHEMACFVLNVGTFDGVVCHIARSCRASGQRIVIVRLVAGLCSLVEISIDAAVG